jgi:hypothetical protein
LQPDTVKLNQPPRLGVYTLATMSSLDTRQVLWTNVRTLMHHHWQREDLGRLAKLAKIGPATCTRIKQQETSVGVEIVDKIAEVFGLNTWQLLVPSLDPANPPMLVLNSTERLVYRKIMDAVRDLQAADS